MVEVKGLLSKIADCFAAGRPGDRASGEERPIKRVSRLRRFHRVDYMTLEMNCRSRVNGSARVEYESREHLC